MDDRKTDGQELTKIYIKMIGIARAATTSSNCEPETFHMILQHMLNNFPGDINFKINRY